MLYLGIDQHARQITISLRDENGDVIEARQVSTKPEKIHDFFQRLTAERLKAGEKFVAVLEVCGFNEWLIRMLRDYRCHKVILIQPEQRTKRKTDRRDAAALSDMSRSFFAENRRVANDRIKRVLGIRLRYPTYREGLAAILAEEAAAG